MTTRRGFSVSRRNDRVALSCSSVRRGRVERRAGFERRDQRLQGGQFGQLLIAAGPRFLGAFTQPLDPAGDDLQVGQQQVLGEAVQIGQRIGRRVVGRDDHDQGARLADQAQLGRVALVRAAQPGRVGQFQRGQRHLLRVIDLAQPLDAGLGHRRHGRLRDVGQAPDRPARR